VTATLEVGDLTETIVVRGSSSEIVNTQTATISSTMNVDQINKMPMPSRNAINAITFLPGVNTPTTNRDSNFNGLPDSFVAIEPDGLRLAESRQADREAAGREDRLQPHRHASPHRRLQLAGRRSKSRSVEQRGHQIPGRAEFQPLHFVSPAVLGCAPLDVDVEPRERASRRHPVGPRVVRPAAQQRPADL
jgi:hypothetical protein